MIKVYEKVSFMVSNWIKAPTAKEKKLYNIDIVKDTDKIITDGEFEFIENEQTKFIVKNSTLMKEKLRLQREIADHDYKVIKCYEYQLVSKKQPYDIQALNAERDLKRARINEIELELESIVND